MVESSENRIEEVITNLKSFAGEDNQNDDITLVELNCTTIPALKQDDDESIKDNILDWSISVSLTADDMRNSDPVSKLCKVLNAMPFVSRHKGVIYILLSEIYANSLEHGILKIEGMDKIDEEHFSEYYKIRNERLINLRDASITFDFKFFEKEEKQYLEMHVSDSGDGYYKEGSKSTDDMLYGRGLNIISSFCEKVSFSDDGKMLQVLYEL